MTIALLLRNTLQAARPQAELETLLAEVDGTSHEHRATARG